ncbi:hypothetical protein COCMIDRAFT_96948 [Bipolaris oryzae ATCC 44560]|uniref:Arrestin-like N-terminal domain-containing protein n=1 Tax=Bipolaris oryzae ATCC 44560 TaxID=930090 RepID=W6ZBQ8_COCMI|nr:uncharacterized protein COCMIDRAFT_96948 [Bipolaris oryzae ATCC 44560]EUC44889.1 hypothetical protein COCMIDRAFT_96948 [Bipolaris oryzae ATCC 44560]
MGPEGPFAGRRANRRDNPVYIHLFNSPPAYTAGDHVRGLLLISQARSPRINIVLRGFSITPHSSGKPTYIELCRESQDLFVSTGNSSNFDLLPTSSSNPGKAELPFSFTFAQHVSLPPPADRDWLHPEDSFNHPRFQHSPGFPLPPSCAATSTDVQIVYQLEVTMESSDPDSLPVRVRQELKYTPPPPDFHPTLLQPDTNFGTTLPKHCSHQKFIRTRKLFQDYEERAGKLKKIKEKLADKELLFGFQGSDEIPYAKFSISATPARVLVVGSQVPVVISIKHLQRSESLASPPDLFIRRLKVQLSFVFNVFTPGDPSARPPKKQHVHAERGHIMLCDKKYEKGSGRLLYDGLSLLDIANVKLTGHDFTPSFTTYGLNLEYELQIEITGKCADREWSSIVCTQPVYLTTAPRVANLSELEDGFLVYDLEPRPAYQEVDPMEPPHYLNVSWGAQPLATTPSIHEFGSRHMAPPIADTVPPPEYTAS